MINHGCHFNLKSWTEKERGCIGEKDALKTGKKLDKMFKEQVKWAKTDFYKNAVADLKTKKPGQWYSSLRRMTSYD